MPSSKQHIVIHTTHAPYGIDVWAQNGRVWLLAGGLDEFTPEEAQMLSEALQQVAREAEEQERTEEGF